jgi:hypothetical protein
MQAMQHAAVKQYVESGAMKCSHKGIELTGDDIIVSIQPLRCSLVLSLFVAPSAIAISPV